MTGCQTSFNGTPLDSWVAADPETRFCDEAWFQLGQDGSVRLGAVLTRWRGTKVTSLTLPDVGDIVCQGLPLAAVSISERPLVYLPAAISGRVVEVNPQIARSPAFLFDSPCCDGWLVRVEPFWFADEAAMCRARHVSIVVNDATKARLWERELRLIGCRVEAEVTPESLADPRLRAMSRILLIDADSLAEDGPRLVKWAHHAADDIRIIVVASADGHWEAAYRQVKVFYYAVRPFADKEIVDIIDAACREHEGGPAAIKPDAKFQKNADPILYSARGGERVRLSASAGLLSHDKGLGRKVCEILTSAGGTIKASPSQDDKNEVPAESGDVQIDREIHLEWCDAGCLPGMLSLQNANGGKHADERDTGVVKPEARRPTVLGIQRVPESATGLGCLDDRTIRSLARHIANEVTERRLTKALGLAKG